MASHAKIRYLHARAFRRGVWNRVTGCQDDERESESRSGQSFRRGKLGKKLLAWRGRGLVENRLVEAAGFLGSSTGHAGDITMARGAHFSHPRRSHPRIIGPFSSRFILFSFRLHAKRSARPGRQFCSLTSFLNCFAALLPLSGPSSAVMKKNVARGCAS